MNEMNRTMIDAIIKKAEALCPDSLALIGAYGSVITGDEYEKSDLDLMILINDENGQVLADGFIIDDVDIGYDIYCTSWDMLENDVQCNHTHLSKLFDSMIVYCKDKGALKKLDEIRRKAGELLASDKRYEKADQAYSNAKKMLAEVCLARSLSKARSCAGAAVELYSNWKNKMTEAAGRDDVYSSFMNLLSLQRMFKEIAEYIAVDGFEIMDKFSPENLEENVEVFDQAMNKYLAEYEKVGICPKYFGNITEFAEDYNKEISEEI